ncbi:MAG: nucleotidyltransferase family protein, partial [Lachnospiraceae bacterium]
MKICGVICEYNPFHLGHEYQLREAKKRSGADAVVCVMSGCFTQRGEAAILPPALRAKHAVLCGADAVIALPVVFSAASAEIFARGAIRLLCSLPGFDCLSFGAEHADGDFYAAAEILNDERAYIEKTKEFLSRGFSFAAARAESLKDTAAVPLLSSPNDILGLEYARALLKENRKKNVTLLPVRRLGDYKKQTLATNGAAEYSSASSIRLAMEKGDFAALSSELPACVSADIQSAGIAAENLKTAERITVLKTRKNELALTADISEGLENALKRAARQPEDIVTQLTSKRYTASRINRILLQNLLGIRKDLLADCLSAPLYVQPLAIRKERKDLLSGLSGG